MNAFPVHTIYDAYPLIGLDESDETRLSLYSNLIKKHGQRYDRPACEPDPEVLDAGGAHHYWTADQEVCEKRLPWLIQFYVDFLPRVKAIAGPGVILSPYSRSGVTAKLYERGDATGWHRDTNPISVLLYLTDTLHGPIQFGDPFHRSLSPQAGDILVFRGRDIPHRVARCGTQRVCVAFNYYYETDIWRPAGADHLVYG